MTKYQKHTAIEDEIEGYPMEFKEYGYEPLLELGVHKGILLMIKEGEKPNTYRYVVGIAVLGDPAKRTREGKLGPLVQINGTVKVGTSWFDNLVEVLSTVGLDLREGDEVESVDWRPYRGTIVEVTVKHETYNDEQRNRIEKFMRARKPNLPGRGRDEGRRDDREPERGRDERSDRGRSNGDREERRPSRAEEKERRAGPWGGDERESRREEPSRREERSGRDQEPTRSSGGGGYGKTYGGGYGSGGGHEDPPVNEADLPF